MFVSIKIRGTSRCDLGNELLPRSTAVGHEIITIKALGLAVEEKHSVDMFQFHKALQCPVKP